MIDNKVKLVVWDLDDTFWDGTLAEGAITPIDRNVDLIKTLTARGILQSICSKNDADRARAELVALGVFDFFVFPRISFDPKGQVVAQLIDEIALRPENVLFIDDNHSNLEEVKYYNPGIMAAHPSEVLDLLAKHPNLAGKPDPGLVRLSQYKLLEQKAAERKTTSLSNEEFLRNCQITISIDYEIEPHLDRVLELINRTNQLNYTKIRIETAEEIDAFRAQLRTYGFHAGCVCAADRYGDYGLVGFFLLKRRDTARRLVHFVFSCRTMHMGIEQYVYAKLGRPQIEIAKPVSYGLEAHKDVDWIEEKIRAEQSPNKFGDQLLVLVGGCELLQLATYCSKNRLEFVNKVNRGVRVRFDDPGFILSDRNAIRNGTSWRKIPMWTLRDTIEFDKGIARAELIIISLGTAVRGRYFKTKDGLTIRLGEGSCRKIQERNPSWFLDEAEEWQIDIPGRLQLILDSLQTVSEKSRRGRIFVLGAYGSQTARSSHIENAAYNRACRQFCDQNPSRLEFVDVESVVPAEHVISGAHFDRRGYLTLATHILERAEAARKAAAARLASERRIARRRAEVTQPVQIQAPAIVPPPKDEAPIEDRTAARALQRGIRSINGLKYRVLASLSWWVRQNERISSRNMGLMK